MIHIVDIGAWPEGVPPYTPLLDARLARLTTFDPQNDDDFALGDGRPATLNICAYPGWTSLLKPNIELLKHLPSSGAWEVRRRLPIETRRLDDLPLDPIDFLKLDVQGSELVILQNGHEKLRGCSAIHIELTFVPLYESQPLYWEVDSELRSQGFDLRTITSTRSCGGQLIELDAVYVRPLGEHSSTIIQHCYPISKVEKAA